TVSISNTDDQTIRSFLNSQVTSDKVKAGLTKAMELKGKLAGTQRELVQVNRTLKDITDDQARLRANLKEMPPTAAAYKRYLDKFDQQETQVEQLQARRTSLQQEEHKQRTGYEAFLLSLDVE